MRAIILLILTFYTNFSVCSDSLLIHPGNKNIEVNSNGKSIYSGEFIDLYDPVINNMGNGLFDICIKYASQKKCLPLPLNTKANLYKLLSQGHISRVNPVTSEAVFVYQKSFIDCKTLMSYLFNFNDLFFYLYYPFCSPSNNNCYIYSPADPLNKYKVKHFDSADRGDILILSSSIDSWFYNNTLPGLISDHVALYLGEGLFLSVHGSEMKLNVQTYSDLNRIYPGNSFWFITPNSPLKLF